MSAKMKKVRIFLLITVIMGLFSACGTAQEPGKDKSGLVNTSHLDSLYEEIDVNGSMMGIIHIYADYPEYKWVSDDDEGAACVDDAARAAVLYINEFAFQNDRAALLKAERLIDFLLFMQSDNGFFYNFIFDDHSINKTHKNSVNEANWWSWRAMWALSEGYIYLKKINPELSARIEGALKKAVSAMGQTYEGKESTTNINGIEIPEWLPSGSASDQAAVLLLALENIYQETKDSVVLGYADRLCDGILMMQKGGQEEIPYGAFLSWQNVWHAYGSGQSYALLKASGMLKRTDLQDAALKEINSFYDYLLQKNFLSSFEIVKDGSGYKFSKEEKYSQIAYNIRPMVFACLEAFSLTDDSAYASKAVKIAAWFFGRNPAGAQMYNPANGICYDGLNSDGINLNSGAESTIEALLSMQMLERNGVSKDQILSHRSE